MDFRGSWAGCTESSQSFHAAPEYSHVFPPYFAPRRDPFVIWRSDVDPHANQGRGWYQGGRKLHGFRSKKYWVRPVDGARRGAWGRLKDGVTGQGPDVFVVANGDRRTLARELPKRQHWSRWDQVGLHWPAWDLMNMNADQGRGWYPQANFRDMPWTKRKRGKVYNFRTRKYAPLHGHNRSQFWSDAHWRNGERERNDMPTCWRDWNGYWNTTVPFDAGPLTGGGPRWM